MTKTESTVWRHRAGIALVLLKYLVPLGIIVYLVVDLLYRQGDGAGQGNTFEQLRDRAKNWPMLVAAFGLAMVAICITFVRWYLLVRALGLPFRLRDAFRLGFLGFLLNFVSVGIVGGDLLKAVFIAHEQPGKRPEAAATVVMDRLVGLFGLLCVTTLVLLLFFDVSHATPKIQVLCTTTIGALVVGSLGILTLFLMPSLTEGRFARWCCALPKVGRLSQRMFDTLHVYRSRRATLAVALGMSLGVHSLMAVSIFLISGALFATGPTLVEHFVIVPLAATAGALPFTPAGLGVYEYAMNFLYAHVPTNPSSVQPGQGLVVALAYRVVTLLVAIIGIFYYWTSRREVTALIHEAEEESTITQAE